MSKRFDFKHLDVFVSTNSSCHVLELISVQWIWCNEAQLRFLTQTNPNPSPYMIVTASQEGYIGLWSVDKDILTLYLERRYVVLPSNIPKSISKNYGGQLRRQLSLFCFDCTNPTSFTCSTLGNLVFTGTLMSDLEISKFTISIIATCSLKWAILLN